MKEETLSIVSDYIEKEEKMDCEKKIVPFSPNDIRLSTPPMNMGEFIDKIEQNVINFGADYQREQNLWDNTQQSRLIESILIGLRLPAFYFEEVNKKEWRIIDGLQRCCAIRNFCVDKTLSLENLEFLSEKFEGKKYDDLSFEDQRDVRTLPVTVNVLERGTPEDVKYILFERLNTGGITLLPQEIRNAIYVGKAIDIVKELSKEESFLKATSYKIPTKRKKDMDFVSRFVSFYLTSYKEYNIPDLDNFININMKKIKYGQYDDNVLSGMKVDFIKAMELASKIFEDDAFRIRKSKSDKKRSLNKAYFEVISVNFSRLSEDEAKILLKRKEVFKERLIYEMKNNTSYYNSFTTGTATKDSVKKRFSTFNNVLHDVLD
ncbi:MAG: DUF262 domain-containing protein [Prevotella sp.]|nr:DUF262 domain-containing protein [Prevotella sp.]